MRVQEIMTREVELINPNTSLRDAARKMRAQNVGALPVGENDRLIGVITDRDITCRAVAEDCSPSQTSVRQAMSEGICYCFEDDDAQEAAHIMAEHQVRRLPVLNRNKRLVGIVGLADLGLCEINAAQEALVGVCEPTRESRRLH